MHQATYPKLSTHRLCHFWKCALSLEMSKVKVENVFFWLKASSGLVSSALFIWNTWSIFKIVINHDVTEVTTTKSIKDINYEMPTFVVCADPPYKNTSRLLQTFEDYEDNAIDVQHLLIGVQLFSVKVWHALFLYTIFVYISKCDTYLFVLPGFVIR